MKKVFRAFGYNWRRKPYTYHKSRKYLKSEDTIVLKRILYSNKVNYRIPLDCMNIIEIWNAGFIELKWPS